ncbi:hypothetical protein HYX04_02515, partial [Candidatus Woesearchaeota archaeon]|nr:hypothetical protein [Candidatus Woesearchaeota archaeon]
SLKRYNTKNKKNKKIKNQIWFRQQPVILHVACRNLDAAKRLLDAARKIFKHSGIISVSDRKIMVEIIGNERIEAIIADKDFAMDENSIKKLIKYANENFEENKRKSEILFDSVKKI